MDLCWFDTLEGLEKYILPGLDSMWANMHQYVSPLPRRDFQPNQLCRILAQWKANRLRVRWQDNSSVGYRHTRSRWITLEGAHTLGQLCHILAQWKANRLRIIWQDDSSVGYRHTQSHWITLGGAHILGQLCCILAQWKANCLRVIRQDNLSIAYKFWYGRESFTEVHYYGTDKIPKAIDDKGWICSVDGKLLLWVPKQYKMQVLDVLLHRISRRRDDPIRIDWDKLVYGEGEKWGRIYQTRACT